MESDDRDGMSLLHYASKEGNLDTVKYLVLTSAKINCETRRGRLDLPEHAEQAEEAVDETDERQCGKVDLCVESMELKR